MKPKWGYIYVHYQNHKRYKPIYPCKLQTPEGEWVDGIVYHGEGNATLWFVRTLAEFNEKFQLSDIQNTSSNQDKKFVNGVYV